MKVNWNRMLISLFLALVFVTACSSPGGGSTQEPINTLQPNTTEAPGDTATAPVQSTPTEIPPTEQTSLCANIFYPVREGSTWTYASTGSPVGEYSFTDTIRSEERRVGKECRSQSEC